MAVLTEAQWAVVAPLIEVRRSHHKTQHHDLRRTILEGTSYEIGRGPSHDGTCNHRSALSNFMMATSLTRVRNHAEAYRVLNEHYPFKCCAVCGLQLAVCLAVAHLDHKASNNAPGNLARLCQTHYWMYDAGLYPLETIRLLQAHW